MFESKTKQRTKETKSAEALNLVGKRSGKLQPFCIAKWIVLSLSFPE
jgi:hypothetical protein